MSYKIGDRVLHDSGWSAVIKSVTNKNGFTIEFDKRIVPENAEDGAPGPQNSATMRYVMPRNCEKLYNGGRKSLKKEVL